jgi:hypothetical protein
MAARYTEITEIKEFDKEKFIKIRGKENMIYGLKSKYIL